MVIAMALLIFPGYRFFFLIKAANDAKKLGSIQLKRFNRWFVYVSYGVACSLLGYVVISISPTKTFSVPTGHMEPAIAAGEYIVVDMSCYRNEDVKAGDVIVFRYPLDQRLLYVKRCVALGGQTVQIRDAVVYVDSQCFMPSLLLKRSTQEIVPVGVKDPRIKPAGAGNEDQYGPVVVPEGTVFTLGDYRDNSLDSRFFGFVNKNDVVGKALYVYWSKDLSRIGSRIR
jgi:signal peptidase I